MEPQQSRCPVCSILIFSRRYPKCEFCGAELPAELLYSEAERAALRKSEVERLEHEMERQRQASKEATAAAQQAALATEVALVAFIALTK